MRMNNQDEGETEQLTHQQFCIAEREREMESCVEIKRGTDGVIGHQQVRDRCHGKKTGREKEVLRRKG